MLVLYFLLKLLSPIPQKTVGLRSLRSSQVALVVKNPSAKACDVRDGFTPWAGKISWRRAWQPIPIFLPGKSMDRGAWRATVPGVAKQLDRTDTA